MIGAIDRFTSLRSCNRDLHLTEVQVQRLQQIRPRFHDHVTSGDTDIGGAVFHVCGDVDRLHEDCAKSFVFGLKDKLPRCGHILRETYARLFQRCQRRFQETALAKSDYKHSFTALPDLRSSSAVSKLLSTLTGTVSVPPSFSVGATICCRRSRLNENPTAGRSSPNCPGSPS